MNHSESGSMLSSVVSNNRRESGNESYLKARVLRVFIEPHPTYCLDRLRGEDNEELETIRVSDLFPCILDSYPPLSPSRYHLNLGREYMSMKLIPATTLSKPEH